MTSVANTVAMTTLALYTLQPHTSFSARQALRRRSQPKRGRLQCGLAWQGALPSPPASAASGSRARPRSRACPTGRSALPDFDALANCTIGLRGRAAACRARTRGQSDWAPRQHFP